MSDPFKNLREQREARERIERMRAEEAASTEIQAKKRLQERVRIRENYNDLVLGVLKQLKEALYPDFHISSHVETGKAGYPSHSHDWDINYSNEDYSQTPVYVTLKFDDSNKPVCFACSRGGEAVRGELSREGLVKALQQLFS